MTLSLAAENSLAELVQDLLDSEAAKTLRARFGDDPPEIDLLRLLLDAHLGRQLERIAWALAQR